MYLYFLAKTLLFLVESKEVYPTQALSLENDITRALDNRFGAIFGSHASYANDDYLDKVQLFFCFWKGNHKYSHNSSASLYDITYKYNINVDELCFYAGKLDDIEDYLILNEKPPVLIQLDFKFTSNDLSLFYHGVLGTMEGNVTLEYVDDQRCYEFFFSANLTIRNISITAFILNEPTHTNIPNISFGEIETKFHFEDLGWQGDGEYELKQEIPLILRDIFNNPDPGFSHIVKFQKDFFQRFIHPKNELISKYPDLLDNPYKFHYLISEFPLFCFTLKTIVLRGLSNFDLFKIQKWSQVSTHILLIKNIEGSMILDYGSQTETPLKLHFNMLHLYVTWNEQLDAICIHAKYYQITRAKANSSLNARQSGVMIDALESAIASSIQRCTSIGEVENMEKICGIESPLEKIKITNTSDWKTIKESYRGWIPFNDDTDEAIAT